MNETDLGTRTARDSDVAITKTQWEKRKMLVKRKRRCLALEKK